MLSRYYQVVPPSGDWYDWVVANVANLRCFYPLDEPSGTTMTDRGPNAKHGTYTGSPTLGASGPVAGHTAATFDGSTQYGSVSHDAVFDLGTSDFSLGFWLREPSWPSGSSAFLFCHAGGGAATEWEAWQNTVANQIRSRVAGVTVSAGTATLNDDAWHLVGLTADRDGNAQWWADGATNGSAVDISSGSGTAIDLTGSLWVARRAGGSYASVSLAGCFLAASLVDMAALWAAR